MIYRDSENGIVRGVCAGLANSFDLNTTGVRIITFLSLLVFTGATLIVYFVAGFLLRDRPLHFDRHREKQFWRSARSHDCESRYTYTRRHSHRG